MNADEQATFNAMNMIFLRKRSSILAEKRDEEGCSLECVATFNANLQSMGYCCTKELFEILRTWSMDEVKELYNSISPLLLQLVGGHRAFKPMYPNFPKQVMEASDAELYFNAMAHYWGFMVSDMIGNPDYMILPQYEKEKRPKYDELPPCKAIKAGDAVAFRAIFTDLLAANSSITPFDKEVLAWFIKNEPEFTKIVLQTTKEIPQKETMAYVAGCLADPEIMRPHLKTATDVLRVAAAMSGGDVSLAEPCKFKSFSKKHRRFLLSVLEECGSSLVEDMHRWDQRWIRLGERLHPGDFKKFQKANSAFDVLRNKKPYENFGSSVAKAIKEKDIEMAVAHLSERGGVFARHLDHLLRMAYCLPAESKTILKSFKAIAKTVSTPVLLQAYNHFLNRDQYKTRSFFPKGNAAKLYVDKDAKLGVIEEKDRLALVDIIKKTLVQRFSKLPKMGKVYLSEALRDHFVPFALRSASKSLKTLTRGSRIALGEGDTVRLFTWWKNTPDRVDIDLSCLMIDENWEVSGQLAFYNLREQGMHHSGDITSAPKGACEFIDINMTNESLIKRTRYVAVVLYSFSQQPYCDLPECFAGWMMREKPNSGEIFEAKSVQNKIDISSDGTCCIPMMIDLKERQAIWMDLSSSGRYLSSRTNATALMARALYDLNKPRLYDLLELHVAARGEQVYSKKNADFVCDAEGHLTPFDHDRIMKEFLA